MVLVKVRVEASFAYIINKRQCRTNNLQIKGGQQSKTLTMESVDIWQQKKVTLFPRGGEGWGNSSFLALTESFTTSSVSSDLL